MEKVSWFTYVMVSSSSLDVLHCTLMGLFLYRVPSVESKKLNDSERLKSLHIYPYIC